MSSLAKLVLPVDFSARSVAAALYSRAIAAHFQSEVILVHVLAPLYSDMGGMEVTGSMLVDVYRNRAAGAIRELEAFAATHLAGVNVRPVLLHGEPSAQIVQAAHAENAGAIAMPTHGYGPFRRFILGSNTAKVLHDADCPVWTGVHLETPPDHPAQPIRRVLCALDLGAQSHKTLAWAAWLAGEFAAELTLIHSITAHCESPEDADREWRTGIRDAARVEIERLQGETSAKGEVLLDIGEPAKAICAAVTRIAADVLVIGRGSASGSFGRLRTNAYAIIRQSPCPVVRV